MPTTQPTVPSKDIFCANCQEITAQPLSNSQSGEIIATCSACGRILKFPANVQKDDFDILIKKQENGNKGQVTVDSIKATLAELIA